MATKKKAAKKKRAYKKKGTTADAAATPGVKKSHQVTLYDLVLAGIDRLTEKQKANVLLYIAKLEGD